MTANAQDYATADRKAQTRHFFYYPALKVFKWSCFMYCVQQKARVNNSDRTAHHHSLQRLQNTMFHVLSGISLLL